MNLSLFRDTFDRIRREAGKVLLGQDEIIDTTLLAILAGGHVLIEGVPGLGKTLLVRTLAHVFGASFRRIQFTPDLMPSDVTGGNVFDQKEDRFVFHEGPVFTQLLLADEINRAPAKTQSALLEAMQDLAVTTDGVTRPLPEPFLVIATQNPVESQGTYPLPEAQLDRFLVKLHVRYPGPAVEKQILRHHVDGFSAAKLDRAGIERIASADEILAMRAALGAVRVDDGILEYITDIVARTRAHRAVYLGSSPRGSIGLLGSARARAASEGRDFVTPDDVKALAPAVLRHRLILHPDAEIEGTSADDCVEDILREAKVPRTAA
ncbi:AAA family ATPase [Polyangium jinanense]|uniref:MoxR family ATPase n=1 Tax=Polyangium jinanense TaxID=2829994 RepID=A0A9X3WZD5_9BACT|nr:MoxR family ATPase [Polyangium jinanense]MDC3955086.1 MoxR family ATPase [Polyangium jinanense]MDC3981144.1 MoxR family ATPase [Polyangium jinanense]